MNIKLTRRALVRTISYGAAALLLCTGIAVQQKFMADDYRRQLENAYTRSLGELSSYLTNISVDLDKGQYIGTSNQLALLSARIWRESGGAKSALSALPINDLNMENTYKFLSQVGDYAMNLSKKVAGGGVLTDEETKNAELLRQYAAKLRLYIDDVQQQIIDNRILVSALRTGANDQSWVDTGFQNLEQTMTGYPTLIYDGPFSDHLLTRKPRLTRGLPTVTPEDAKAAAAKAASVLVGDLTRADDENSNMPSYTFNGKNIAAGVTKSGGLITYMINSREIGEQRISRDSMFTFGNRYLEDLGIYNMRVTYYEIADGICTINYAAMKDDITLYTDLIKVGVALDDGGVVFFDARGYISNHRERSIEPPTLSIDEAARSVNPNLVIQSQRTALIPTSGKNEVLTYEFLTESDKGQQILVYVNAYTGAEEEILLLVKTPSGILTK